jgi:hypothetical protein
VNAVNASALGLRTDAYGIGGVESLNLTVMGNAITLDALDLEMQAFGSPNATSAAWSCDLVDPSVQGQAPAAGLCLPCGTGMNATCTAAVRLHEVLPPVEIAPGKWEYQGSAVHVHVAVPGAATVDLYVGYVDLVVDGGPAAEATHAPEGALWPLASSNACGPYYAVPGGQIYVSPEGPRVWLESDGRPGFQCGIDMEIV